MLFAVVKFDEGSRRQVCVDKDGTHQTDPDRCELFSEAEARDVAAKFGGAVLCDSRLFPQDFPEDHDDE